MTGEVEALGGLATAGLVAKALDRQAPGEAGHGLCPNCGADVGGRFCATCGQAAHVHRSLIHVVEEFLHGITHFDGKAWQTLPMLAFRPGTLTRQYIMGRRARYIPPVSLFLLVVFTMVLVFSRVAPTNFGVDRIDDGTTVEEAQTGLVKTNAAIADIDAEIAKARRSGNTGDLPGLASARAGAEFAKTRFETRIAGKPLPKGETRSSVLDSIREANARGRLNVSIGSPELEAKVHRALENPELALYKVQGVAYKFSFLLVPLSLPWLWLMFFWKRGVRMYDHAVFSLYSISFMSLLFTLASIIYAAGVTDGGTYFALLLVAPLVHMYAQLKGAYALSRFGAAWRMVVLANLSVLVLAFYAIMMLVVGLIE